MIGAEGAMIVDEDGTTVGATVEAATEIGTERETETGIATAIEARIGIADVPGPGQESGIAGPEAGPTVRPRALGRTARPSSTFCQPE